MQYLDLFKIYLIFISICSQSVTLCSIHKPVFSFYLLARSFSSWQGQIFFNYFHVSWYKFVLAFLAKPRGFFLCFLTGISLILFLYCKSISVGLHMLKPLKLCKRSKPFFQLSIQWLIMQYLNFMSKKNFFSAISIYKDYLCGVFYYYQ